MAKRNVIEQAERQRRMRFRLAVQALIKGLHEDVEIVSTLRWRGMLAPRVHQDQDSLITARTRPRPAMQMADKKAWAHRS
jgi:hypothetical protein